MVEYDRLLYNTRAAKFINDKFPYFRVVDVHDLPRIQSVVLQVKGCLEITHEAKTIVDERRRGLGLARATINYFDRKRSRTSVAALRHTGR